MPLLPNRPLSHRLPSGRIRQPERRACTQHAEVPATASCVRPLVVVNGRASGVGDAEHTPADLVALLREQSRAAEGAVTMTQAGFWEALRAAADEGRRLVLVGGDGSMHSAANAPLAQLALVPAGRANNVARALGIPVDSAAALEVAANAPARPLDALLVTTPERRLYAVEGVSAGFHAAARASYTGENSADPSQGARALAGAVRGYAPYRVSARVEDRELISAGRRRRRRPARRDPDRGARPRRSAAASRSAAAARTSRSGSPPRSCTPG
jgi:Diacylglycerol kinase catalytic domain